MKIIAIAARKGGAGKTTTAIHLAGALAKARIIAVIDLDRQRSATAWSGNASLPFIVKAPKQRGYDPFTARAIGKAVNDVNGADIIILDGPPAIDGVTKSALLLADLALIPAGASPLDVYAAKSTVELVREVQEFRGGKPLCGLVPSRLQNTTFARDLPATLAALGEEVTPAIGLRVALAESILEHQWIGQYAPDSPGHHEFKALAAWVLERL